MNSNRVEYIETSLRILTSCDSNMTEASLAIAIRSSKRKLQAVIELVDHRSPSRSPIPFGSEHLVQASQWSNNTCSKMLN